MENQLNDLSENIRRNLIDFIDAVKSTCGSYFQSIVLFGSAAEGRLRSTSDVNLMLVLREFEVSQINQLRETFRMAHAAIRLNVMFILESEISIASEAFAVKFSDIIHRHRILLGPNPFTHLDVSRTATLQRLKQVIINLTLRLRERYMLVSLREEQLFPLIADVTGPLRAVAATILSLEGKTQLQPKEALEILTRQLPPKNWPEILSNMSKAREKQELKPGEGISTLLGILQLLKELQQHVQDMK